MSIKKRVDKSALTFVNTVWPQVGHLLGGGDVLSVEKSRPNPVSDTIDMLAGVDSFQIVSDMGARGIAVHLQYTSVWPTFSIRTTSSGSTNTELRKRVRAIVADLLYPPTTLQAYVPEGSGKVAYMCSCKTKDLYGAILTGCPYQMRKNPVDGNDFMAVWVEDLRSWGVAVIDYGEACKDTTFYSRGKR